jgi:hypothetical protein
MIVNRVNCPFMVFLPFFMSITISQRQEWFGIVTVIGNLVLENILCKTNVRSYMVSKIYNLAFI